MSGRAIAYPCGRELSARWSTPIPRASWWWYSPRTVTSRTNSDRRQCHWRDGPGRENRGQTLLAVRLLQRRFGSWKTHPVGTEPCELAPLNATALPFPSTRRSPSIPTLWRVSDLEIAPSIPPISGSNRGPGRGSRDPAPSVPQTTRNRWPLSPSGTPSRSCSPKSNSAPSVRKPMF